MQFTSLLLAVTLVIAADDSKQGDNVPDELRGVWVGKSADLSEKSTGFEGVWEFKDDKIVSTLRDRTTEYKYRIDLKTSPKAIDLTPGTGPSAGKVIKAIFKVEKDTLTVCQVRMTAEGAKPEERPTEFDVKKRSDVVILTFERKKP